MQRYKKYVHIWFVFYQCRFEYKQKICEVQKKDLPLHYTYFLILSSIGWLVWRIYRNKLEKKYYDDKINFFVNTAHDIRTPLSLVLAPLNDMAKDKELSEQSKNFLKITGTGLGLMITRRMAEKMNASLTFESKEGQGTIFTLKPLPTTIDKELINNITTEQTTHENQQSATTNTIYEPKTTKDSLLFVDDNEELRNYIQMAFQNFYNITTVDSGEKALEFLQSQGTCDIVVSDVMMPGMQGTELCNHIKENANTSWLPVILLTAKSGKDFMINGLQLGADDYVTKPFDPEILRTKIDSMLQNRRRLSKYYLDKAIAMVQGKNQEVPIKEETTTKEEATTQEPAEIKKVKLLTT